MEELVLTDVDTDLLHQLQRRAASHGRTPAEEAKAVLAEALDASQTNAWGPIDAFCDQLAASGRKFSDSASLLREDRER